MNPGDRASDAGSSADDDARRVVTRISIVRGAVWMVLARLLERSLGLASVLVLARLLIPADFGLVAMAMSVIALIELATAFSFDIALIQRDVLTRAHYDTAWTLNVAFAAGCGLVTAALAHPSALFYSEPRLTAVMLALAAGWFVQGFENVGIVNFRRSMNFSREFAFVLSKKLAAFAVTVILAAVFRSYWALVAGTLVSRFTGVALSYVLEPFRPRLSLQARRDLFSFSSWLLANNILNFAVNRISHFAVGRLHGAMGLGLFTVGSEIALLPTTELVAPINRAVFPGYARMTQDPERFRQGFLEVVAVITAFALPASFGIAATAAPVVSVLLGEKWAEAVPVVQILAFAGGIGVVMSNTYSAYLALGRPSILTAVKAGEIVILLPAMLVLSPLYGIRGIAYAQVVATALTLLWSYPVLFRALDLRVGAYADKVWRSIVAAIGMGLSVQTLVGSLSGLSALATLAIAVPAGAVCYVALLFFLWFLSGRPAGAERLLLDRIRNRRGQV